MLKGKDTKLVKYRCCLFGRRKTATMSLFFSERWHAGFGACRWNEKDLGKASVSTRTREMDTLQSFNVTKPSAGDWVGFAGAAG